MARQRDYQGGARVVSNVTDPKRWKIVLLAGFAIYAIGLADGVAIEHYPASDALVLIFLAGISIGPAVSLIASVVIGLKSNASLVIASGCGFLFLGIFVSVLFERLGGSFNIHDSFGIAFMTFGATAIIGGILLLGIGLVRMSAR